MRSLAFLDLATSLGFAVGRPDGNPRWDTKTLPSTGDDVGRFIDAYDVWLNDFLALEPDLACLAFEAPIIRSGKTALATARKLMGLASHTEFVCRRRQVVYFEANLMTVKKFFAGHGHADKDQMIATARRYGWAVKTEHEADACGGWAYAVWCKAPAFGKRFAGGPVNAAPLMGAAA